MGPGASLIGKFGRLSVKSKYTEQSFPGNAWMFVCEEETRINLRRLDTVLQRYDSSKVGSNSMYAHRIRISGILPWDRKSYLTHAILPRTSSNIIM